ncbi:MAG: phosphatidylglycerophosphatase A [Candidatus Omnitrophota bacterium]
MKKFSRAIASLFGVGYAPFASGSAASFVGLVVVYYFIRGNIALHSLMIILSFIAGFLTIKQAEKEFGREDPREIVLDEFIGMLIALYLLPLKPVIVAGAYFFFRLFDVVKPWPIFKLEKLKSPHGIILDDVLAAIYANLTMQGIYYFVFEFSK